MKRDAELNRQDSLDAPEEERDIAKARSAFYQQQARRYQSREVRAKTYNVDELVLCLPEKKKDKLKPKWEGAFIIDQLLTGRSYRLRMHQIIDSSQTHGPQPDSKGSTPSVGLYVRLLTSVKFLYICYLSFLSFFLPFFLQGLKRLKCVLTTQS